MVEPNYKLLGLRLDTLQTEQASLREDNRQIHQQLNAIDRRIDQMSEQINDLRKNMNNQFESLRNDITLRITGVENKLDKIIVILETISLPQG
jgi:archaellum component FlaC